MLVKKQDNLLSKLLILRSRVRKIITATICKYHDCGIMENGFAPIVGGGCQLPLDN